MNSEFTKRQWFPKKEASRIGFFGGSFDPPHLGHLALAKAAKETLPIDTLVFIVTSKSPFKLDTKNASFSERLQMLALALKEEGLSDEFTITDLEGELPTPNYTVETLNFLKEKGVDLKNSFFLMGEDAGISFDHWKDSEAIRSQIGLAIFKRKGVESHSESTPPQAAWIPADLPEVSSTTLRNHIKNLKTCPKYLQKSVFDFIKENHIYE